MEDQPAERGDLTTGAELPAQPAGVADAAADAAAARRRHRMPLRQQLAASREDAEDTATEEPPEAEAAGAVAVGNRPRVAGGAFSVGARKCPSLRLFRRRRTTSQNTSQTGAAHTGRKASRATKAVTEPNRRLMNRLPTSSLPTRAPKATKRTGRHRSSSAPARGQAADHRGGRRQRRFCRCGRLRRCDAAVVPGRPRAGAHQARVARTAANAITTLWTYTPDNMESLPDGPRGTWAATSPPSTASTSTRSSRPTSRRRSPTPPR